MPSTQIKVEFLGELNEQAAGGVVDSKFVGKQGNPKKGFGWFQITGRFTPEQFAKIMSVLGDAGCRGSIPTYGDAKVSPDIEAVTAGFRYEGRTADQIAKTIMKLVQDALK